jgi:hypothetical protein
VHWAKRKDQQTQKKIAGLRWAVFQQAPLRLPPGQARLAGWPQSAWAAGYKLGLSGRIDRNNYEFDFFYLFQGHFDVVSCSNFDQRRNLSKKSN